MEETVKRFVELQRVFLKSISDQQAAFINQQTAFINQQTAVLASFSEQQTAFLTSMSEILWSANSQKSDNNVQDKDLVMKEREEDPQLLTESSNLPCRDLSSRPDEKKYRLHIVGKVCHKEETDENGRSKMIVFRERPITGIEVILKHGDEQVPASHHLASLTVELVVMDGTHYVEGMTDWSREEFERHRIKTLKKGIFSLDGGRKVHSVASIKESSGKQKVRLGVMAVVKDGVQPERVLEGMSSNEFYVIHPRRLTTTVSQIIRKLNAALRKFEGKDPIHRNLKELQDKLFELQRILLLQDKGHPLGIDGIIASIRKVTGDADILKVKANSDEVNSNEGGAVELWTSLKELEAQLQSVASQQQLTSTQAMQLAGKRKKNQEQPTSTSCSQSSEHNVQSAQQFSQQGQEQPSQPNQPTTPMDIICTIDMTIVSKIICELLPPALRKFEGKDPIHRNLKELQEKLFELQRILLLQDKGYNGTADGGQAGQPSTPFHPFLNYNLYTNAQGYITTAPTACPFTSAQHQPPRVQGQNPYGTSGSQTYPRQTREINRSVLEEQQRRSHGMLRAWNVFSAYLSVSPLNILSSRLLPGMGEPAAGSGGQYGTVSWRPSYSLTPKSSWTSGWSPTYLGQTQGSNRNFEGYYVLNEHENVYAYGAGEQIQTAYGALFRRPAASVHRLRHHKVSDYDPYVSPGNWQVINDDHARQAVNKMAEFIDQQQQLRPGMNIMGTMNNQQQDARKEFRVVGPRQAVNKLAEFIYQQELLLRPGSMQQQDTRMEIRVAGPESSIVKQESHVWCGDGDKKGSTESFGQFVVVDFKASCVSKDDRMKQGLPFEQEIIELSSVLVNAMGHLTSAFHTYVSPIKNPVLSRFCMEYNDIKQEDVEYGAVMLSEALQMHKAWIEENLGGRGGGGLGLNGAVVVTWGNWDCRTMLKQECQRKELLIPDYFKRWINLKIPFVERYGSHANKTPIHLLGVHEAFEVADLKWEGPLKGGRSLARNKARLLSSLIQQGAKLAVTSWLDPARRAGTESSSSSSGGTFY